MLASQKTMTILTKTSNKKLLETSYLSHSVAQTCEAHIIAESLIKLYTIDTVKCLLNKKAGKLVSNILLLNNTSTK